MLHPGVRCLSIALIILICACEVISVPAPQPAATISNAAIDTPIVSATFPPRAFPTVQPTAQVDTRRITKLGAHMMLEDKKEHWPTSEWAEHLGYARELVGGWGFVLALVRLDDLDVSKWQLFLDECQKLHLTPIFRLATEFDKEHQWWIKPTPDAGPAGGYTTVAQRYRNFLENLKWPTPTHYVIVGNEPNRGAEWGNEPSADAYAHFLSDVSRTIRAADANMMIISGALDPYAPNTNGQPFNDGYRYIDADTFLTRMSRWDKNIFDRIQIWGSHAYPLGPFIEAPDKQLLKFDYLNGAQTLHVGQWPGNVFNRGINSYVWDLAKIAELGGPPLPVMITETGWRHQESTVPSPPDGPNAVLTAAQVADYFEMAFVGNQRFPQYARTGWIPWQDDKRVLLVIPFMFDGFPGDWGHSNWLQLDSTGHVLDSYEPYRRMTELNH